MRKMLIGILMLLMIAIPVSAFIRQQGFSRDTLSNSTISDCQVFNSSQPKCDVFQTLFIMDYKNNPDFFINSVDGTVPDDVMQGKYVAYMQLDVNAYALSGERFFGRVNKTQEVCYVYDAVLNGTVPHTIYDEFQYGNKSFHDFIRIELDDNQYVRCEFNTFYINQSLFLTNTPISTKLWKPTYQSTMQQPCKLNLLKKQDELGVCQSEQIGASTSDKEYVKLAIKRLAYYSYTMLIWIFWIFVIGLLVLALEIIITVPFIIVRLMRKLMKKVK